MDPSVIRFLKTTHLHKEQSPHSLGSDTPWINQLLHVELPTVLTQLPAPEPLSGSCLLQDVGDFTLRLIQTIASLVEEVSTGNRLKAYAEKKLGEAAAEHDLSDLEVVDYLDGKQQALKQGHFCEQL
ncbi:MAG: hypothetical protein M1833_004871 [Piccolia ochrophora]|nr:MAG: hypothetical protein M1833_004871 [Piccolia ochrophora]